MAIGDGGLTVGGIRRPFRSLGIASSGLSGQRARIETIANNIANATSINADGTPYQKKVAVLQEAAFDPVLRARMEPGTDPDALRGGVQVAGIQEVESQGVPVYDPSHPNADENGYVMMPDISVTDEMVDLMDARRLYDANATVFEAIKGMLRRAAQI